MLAVMEAVAAGCIPVVPDRLCYREIYPSHFRYDSHVGDPQQEAESAVELIQEWALNIPAGKACAPDMSAFAIEHLSALYRQSLQNLDTAQDSH